MPETPVLMPKKVWSIAARILTRGGMIALSMMTWSPVRITMLVISSLRVFTKGKTTSIRARPMYSF